MKREVGARHGKPPAQPWRRALARQQRLGILYNPNRAPAPPARRARLMGKWLSLKSSRRPRADVIRDNLEACDAVANRSDGPSGLADAAPPPQKAGRGQARGGGTPIISLASDDSLRIDTERLMGAVAGRGRKEIKRRPFAEKIVGDPGHPVRRTPPALQTVPAGPADKTGMPPAGTTASAAGTAIISVCPDRKGGRVDALSAALRSPAQPSGARAALAAAVRFPRLIIGQTSEPGQSVPKRSATTRLKRSLRLNGIAVIVVMAAAAMVVLIARLVPAA